MTSKSFGRTGDAPSAGVGSDADDNSGAVLATGQGEFFVRQAVAPPICAEVQYSSLLLLWVI